MEKKSRLSRSLVLGRRSDGRCRYDPDIKRELVEICQQPGVSVARIALEHGINANLLRQWIQSYREQVKLTAPKSRGNTTGKFQASCRLSVKILSGNLLLVSNLLGRFVLGFSLIRI